MERSYHQSSLRRGKSSTPSRREGTTTSCLCAVMRYTQLYDTRRILDIVGKRARASSTVSTLCTLVWQVKHLVIPTANFSDICMYVHWAMDLLYNSKYSRRSSRSFANNVQYSPSIIQLCAASYGKVYK